MARRSVVGLRPDPSPASLSSRVRLKRRSGSRLATSTHSCPRVIEHARCPPRSPGQRWVPVESPRPRSTPLRPAWPRLRSTPDQAVMLAGAPRGTRPGGRQPTLRWRRGGAWPGLADVSVVRAQPEIVGRSARSVSVHAAPFNFRGHACAEKVTTVSGRRAGAASVAIGCNESARGEGSTHSSGRSASRRLGLARGTSHPRHHHEDSGRPRRGEPPETTPDHSTRWHDRAAAKAWPP